MAFQTTERYEKVTELIDLENSKDPNIEMDNVDAFPKELLYSMRMVATLEEYAPQASELVYIAARGQHIKRWAIDRNSYPEGKKGYHQWRNDLTDLHCTLLANIMQKYDYSKEEAGFVENLIRKKDLKNNPESQLLQDVVSIVFLRYYAEDFAKKHSDKNISDILKKVLRKMSDKAIEKAMEVCKPSLADVIKTTL